MDRRQTRDSWTALAPRPAGRGIELRPGDVLGRWRVLEALGQGGMGIVFRAELEGVEYALKVVHPHLVERADLLRRFQREAEAGARVRHANVARTFGVETAEVRGATVHFLVMELVGGRTLMEVQGELGRLPEGLLRDVAVGIAGGLEAIHAVGIVHRDLKPENVMLTARHEVKVMDLGIAAMANEDARLSRAGQFVGSILFAAPEQLGEHPERLTPSADLYALGCVLHQLAVGRHALEDMPVAEVVNAHLHRPWPRLSQSLPEVSLFFDALVATLLEKDPARRFPDARTVRETLIAGEASPWWTARRALGRGETPLPGGLPPGSGLGTAPAGLVGRARELRALGEEWRKARGGAGGAVLLVGAEGAGKTRLLDAFLEAPRDRPGHVLRAGAPASGDEPPLPFALVRTALGVVMPDGFGPREASELVPALGSRAVALADLLRTGGAGLSPERLPEAARDVAALLVALAARLPRVLAFDDVDRAGAGDRAAFAEAARLAPRAPLLLVATATAPLDPAWRHELRATGGVAETVLSRLGEDDLRRLLTDLTGLESTAATLAPHVLPRAAGLPRALERLVEAWRASGALERGADGALRPTGARPPDEADGGLEPLVRRWLGTLAPEGREVVEAACVQGLRFDARLVAAVLGKPPLAVSEALVPLGREPRLVLGEGQVRRFDPPLAVEVVRAGLPAARLAALHRRTAEVLAEAAASQEIPPLVAAPRIAEHFLRARAPERAAPWIVPALDLLVAAGSSGAGLELAELALGAQGAVPAEVRCDVLARRATLLGLDGRIEDERHALEEAFEAHRAAGREPAVAMLEAYGRCLASMRDQRRGDVFFREVLAASRRAGPSPVEAAAEGILARLALDRGDPREARGHAERALLLARALGDGAREVSAFGHVAEVLEHQGRLELCGAHQRSRLSRATRLGLSREAADAHAGLARLALRAGRWREAQVHLDRQATIAEPIGWKRGTARARHGAGLVALARGRLGEARDHFAAAYEAVSGAGHSSDLAVAGADLARALAWIGDADRARAVLLRAVGAAGRSGDPRALAIAHVACGEAALDHGDPDEAASWYRDAIALSGPSLPGEIETAARLGLAAALLVRADPARALEALDAAVAAAARGIAPGPRVVAAARRATAPDGDPLAAVALLARHGDVLAWRERVEVHLALFRATRDPWDLAEASRHVTAARDLLTPPDRALFDAGPLARAVAPRSGDPR